MYKYGIGDGYFINKCCEMTLQYYPDYINALLLKVQIITGQHKQEDSPALKKEMDKFYTQIHQLGYRKMPTEMYLNWLYSLNEYSNEYRKENHQLQTKSNKTMSKRDAYLKFYLFSSSFHLSLISSSPSKYPN